MATAISMPRLGMTMEEGTVVEWPIAVGDRVTKGETVLVIESEKNEVEIDAQASGHLRHVYVSEGETVPCGVLLGAITETADEPFDAEAFRAEHAQPAPPTSGALVVKSPGAKAKKAERAERAEAPSPEQPARKPIAPAARAAARKLGIDPATVTGTGPNGRVTRQDVEAHAEARQALVPVAEGVALEVLATGEGDPVVLIPGLGTDASAFTRQAPALAERHHVRAVHLRGVGHSDAPASDAYTVAQSAADVAASYEGAADLVGASLGAAVAIELALTRPERVRSLTLVTPFSQVSARLRSVADGWRRVAAEASPETLAAALLPWLFSSAFLADDAARSRTLRGLAQTVSRVPAPVLDRHVAGMAAWSGTRTRDLASLSVPTLVIVAGDDLLAPDGEALAAAIPHAEVVVLGGAGHAVAIEAPDDVNAAILGHLERRR